MSTAANKANKKLAVLNQVKLALALARKVEKKTTTAREALEDLLAAWRRLKDAEALAQPHVSVDRVRRDALPAPIRRRITRLAEQMEKVVADVRALPVTRDEAVAQKVERARKRETKGDTSFTLRR